MIFTQQSKLSGILDVFIIKTLRIFVQKSIWSITDDDKPLKETY